jgi:HEAT repeat protein
MWSTALVLALAPFGWTAEPVVDLFMNQDPPLTVSPVEKTFPKGLADMWLAALDRPDADTRCQAAASFGQGHERGVPGLSVAIVPLTRLVEKQDEHPAGRLAAARSLVALDARDAAPALFRVAGSGGPELREIIEPALARWDYKPARSVWLERLGRSTAHRRDVLLAIRALGVVREEKAIDGLKQILLAKNQPQSHRLAAARSLSAIRPSGFEADARALIADRSGLLAATLLRQHQGNEAVKLLQELAVDREPGVAVLAVGRLVEIDTKLVVPVLEKVLASANGDVRLLGVETLFRQPSADHVRLLGNRLVDPHPEVRSRARANLRELANKPELRDVVIRQGEANIGAADWRGLEQAIYLLTQLDQKKQVNRYFELLDSERPEVAVAAAWGIRVLAVPETLPRAHEHIRLRHKQLVAKGKTAGLPNMTPEAVDRQMSQLVQFLGQARFKAADATLRALIPRGSMPFFTPVGGETRGAAAWALGWFHEGNPEPGLAKQIEDRLTGDPGIGPDDPRLRRMAAIALGRMKATQSLEALKTHGGDSPTTDLVAHACRWAISQITGEPIPKPGNVQVLQTDWFLLPLR